MRHVILPTQGIESEDPDEGQFFDQCSNEQWAKMKSDASTECMACAEPSEPIRMSVVIRPVDGAAWFGDAPGIDAGFVHLIDENGDLVGICEIGKFDRYAIAVLGPDV